jgi:hypothetical protein
MVAAAQVQLDEVQRSAMWAEGRTMKVEQAIIRALED